MTPPSPPPTSKPETPLCPVSGDLTRQLLTVTKPSGHLSHIFNAGTDHKLLDEARAAHEAGKGPSVGTTLVQPNGADLQQVGCLTSNMSYS